MKVGKPPVVAALVLAAVFALGVVGGGVGAGLLAHRHLHTLLEGTEEEVEVRVTLALLGRALRLREDERARLRDILQRDAVVHTQLRETIEPGLAALRLRERGEIRAMLTPEQLARFDQLSAMVDARRGRVERLLDK
jgi:hypothetical protein